MKIAVYSSVGNKNSLWRQESSQSEGYNEKMATRIEQEKHFPIELKLFILLESWHRLSSVFMTCKLKYLIFIMFKYKQQQFSNQKE